MSVTQNEYYVELSSFDDLARLTCALQEYPKRVYSQELDGTRISFCRFNNITNLFSRINLI